MSCLSENANFCKELRAIQVAPVTAAADIAARAAAEAGVDRAERAAGSDDGYEKRMPPEEEEEAEVSI